MNKTTCIFVLITLFFLQIGCTHKTNSIKGISIDYPHGEQRLLVQRNGEALLFYGSRPQFQKVKNGTFNIDTLYKQLQKRLHNNVPRDKWPNPNSTAGMVTIDFDNNTKKDYLIFDEEEFTESLFNKASKNIVGQIPSRI